jgi:signal transduction histidine kinase
MSIRLRLTLIYTLTLALLLLAASLLLYFSQIQAMARGDQYTLKSAASRITASWPALPEDRDLHPRSEWRRETYIQTRTLDGKLIQADPDLDGLVLPLTEANKQSLRQGDTCFETASLNDEEFLIYNQPLAEPNGTPLIIQTAMSLAHRERFLDDLRNILMVGSTVILMLVCGISWVLAGLALRPIHRITQTARAIGTERDFSRRVNYTGPNDEIGQLAVTFNAMVTELQAAYLQMEDTLQAQRRFLADASHELRTPLTTLRGNLGLLQHQPPISEEDRTDVLTDMVEETERLTRLVNELLVLARVDAGRPLQQEPIALQPLLEDVCQQVRLLAPQRTLVCRAEAEATIMADSDALKQIMLVLLDNALNHTPPEATVTLTTRLTQGQVAIEVSDNGPGIASIHLPYIFDRFYRGDATRTSPGTGLGLAIADELTKAQQGIITVESQVGRGSTFTLKFPAASSL